MVDSHPNAPEVALSAYSSKLWDRNEWVWYTHRLCLAPKLVISSLAETFGGNCLNSRYDANEERGAKMNLQGKESIRLRKGFVPP
jgi:hypothetical protein